MNSEIKDLLSEIVKNPDLLKDYTKDELEDLYKKANPYGKVLNQSKGYTCISVTNMRDRYIANLKMTSLVGFVYRMLKEYDDLFHYDEDEKDETQQKASKIKQAIIKEFLDKIFEHNPEDNVASSYNPNPADSERKPLEMSAADPSVPAPINIADTIVPVPTYDAFYRWQWYEDANYDKLLEVAANIYADKHDFDYAVQVHKSFDDVKEAEKFQKENGPLTIAPIIIVENNEWTVLGSYSKNRERINFYNKENQVLQKIFDRVKADQDYGTKLMKNRVIRKKKKNIDKNGAENTDIEKYARELGNGGAGSVLNDEEREKLRKYAEERAAIKAAMGSGDSADAGGADANATVDPRDIWENVDEDGVPNDAIIVGVFENDGKSLNKSCFFTKASVPESVDIKSG